MTQRDPLVAERQAAHDRSLMERIQAGDPAALDTVLETYWAALVSYADRLLSDRDAAEDVVQDAMMALWSERSRWTPTQRLKGFLYQVTRNLALNEYKKRKVRNAWAETSTHEPRPEAPDPLELTERAELQALLEEAIDALPPRRREVFILARYHGHSYREIAEIMEISTQTVANQMSAALDGLRAGLGPRLEPFVGRGQLRVLLGGDTADSRPITPADSRTRPAKLLPNQARAKPTPLRP